MSILLTLNIFTPCSGVSIVNFEHVAAGWEMASPFPYYPVIHQCSVKEKIQSEKTFWLSDFFLDISKTLIEKILTLNLGQNLDISKELSRFQKESDNHDVIFCFLVFTIFKAPPPGTEIL